MSILFDRTSQHQANMMINVLHRRIADGLFEYTTGNLNYLFAGKEDYFDTFAKKFLMLG